MSLEQARTQPTSSHQPQSQVGTRLQGGWLVLTRIAWVVVVGLTLLDFIVNIPFNFANAHLICTAAGCRSSGGLTLERVQELHRLGLSLDLYALLGIVLSLVFEVGYLATGVVIFWRKSDDRMALVTSFALVTFGSVFHNPIPLATQPPWLHVLTLWMAFFGNSCFGLFSYTFPTGRFVPRWVGFLALIWIVLWGFTNLVLASFFQPAGLATVLFFGLLASIVVMQVYGYRRVSTPAQRQQTKWVVFGLSAALVGFLVSLIVLTNVPLGIIAEMVVGVLLDVFLLLIPLSIGIAILRSHLWDIDLIINRALVYGTLTTSVVGIYVLIVGVFGKLLQAEGNLLISLVATGLVAVVFQPLRNRLQRAVNRLTYGERDEPYRVLSRLGQRLEATLAPDAVLPTLVETVAQALKLPYAAITLKQEGGFVAAASYGSPQENLTCLPLVYQTEQIGELVLAPRTPGETFSAADQGLLNDLARQAGIAAHAVRLTADLQRSREHLVTAREEERRRLRRDLHDGLGPTLGALALKAGSARALFPSNPAVADRLMGELEHDIETAVADIRRLVYALRPPTLDELGLVGAMRECAAQYSTPGGGNGAARQNKSLQISVEAPERLPPLLAAVEVAAYRIVQEALTNVARHAQAKQCTVCLSFTGALQLEIRDDGIGLPVERLAGIGLTSMRERAQELGGTCRVETMPTGGTRVLVCLPLPHFPGEDS